MGLIVCPSCGEESPDRFRHCGLCGARLAPETPAAEVRKTVTVVFSDLVGSTGLGERLDSETLREVLSLYFAAMRRVLEHHGGLVEKYIGDAVMAVFGLPRVREDDALRAVRAALEMGAALAVLNHQLERDWGVRLENRTGVHTGEVVAGDPSAGQRLVTGDAVNVAARLEQACPPLQVLIGEPTYRLVRGSAAVDPVPPLALRGRSERFPAYRLHAVHLADTIPRRLDAELVGRDRELAQLAEVLAGAVGDGRGRLVTVVAPAGVGKSRLLGEFVSRQATAIAVLRSACLSYGDDVTFRPIAAMVRGAAGVGEEEPAEEVVARLGDLLPGQDEVIRPLAALVGLGDERFPMDESLWAVTRFMEALARPRPLVAIVDDVHWAEPGLRRLIHHVAAEARAPIVITCSARPELLDEEPDWGDGPGRVLLRIDPLSDADCLTVADRLLGPSVLNPAIRRRLTAAAAGNPLFVEQLIAMLIDNRRLVRDDEGTWRLTSDAVDLAVPPSIAALLAARLDRLATGERTVIDRAAVVGTDFSGSAVRALLPEALREGMTRSLEVLVRRDLIAVAGADANGSDAYHFRHGLIRETAYQGLLKRTRAELHERLVEWFESQASQDALEEFRGYHLEQAHAIRTELGRADERTARLGQRGATYLATAGRRALERGDPASAAALLERAAALVGAGSAERARLLTVAGDALTDAGDLEAAEAVLAQAEADASAAGVPLVATAARVARLSLHFLTEGAGVAQPVLEEAEAAIPRLEAAGDHAGLVRAWRLVTNVHGAACRYLQAEAAAAHWVAAARRSGDRGLEEAGVHALASCAQLGPTPVPTAIRVCRDVLATIRVNRSSRAIVLRALSNLEAMQAEFERARQLYRESRAILEELGMHRPAALTSAVASGPVELLAGDAAAAERELRRDHEALQRMGERNYISTTAAFLAEAVYRQQRLDEALDLTIASEQIAAPDDASTQALWRSVRAKVLARRGRLAEAETLARDAVALIAAADDPESQGHALLDLAEVLACAGRMADAALTADEARQRFEQKGDIVSAARSADLITRLGAPT